MKHRPYFPQTAAALDAITSIYDFLWPTAVALWNLRWQVAGFAAAGSSATVPALRARFIEGSGISGANLSRACIDTAWDEQTTMLASVLLTNLFSAYEGWATKTVAVLGLAARFDKALQYPGATAKVAALPLSSTRLVEDSVYPVLISRPRYDLQRLEGMLLCYRYFKEVRNVQLHNHAIADSKCEEAFKAFAAVATPAHLAAVPEYRPALVGSRVTLTLRGVVGFSDLLRRILYTLDAELARHPAAQPCFEADWRTVCPKGRTFKSDRAERHRQLRGVFSKLGYTGVTIASTVENELRTRALALW